MAIELTIDHSKSDAQEAITQFAARRRYQLSHPWYLDGLRIEDTSRAGENIPPKSESGHGFWAGLASLFHVPAPGPRVDIELKRRKGRTVVSLSLGGHHESVHLAYALRAYLSDDRAFTCECPPLCPACSALVRNVTANYCCQCGHLLAARPPIPMTMPVNNENELVIKPAVENRIESVATRQAGRGPKKIAEPTEAHPVIRVPAQAVPEDEESAPIRKDPIPQPMAEKDSDAGNKMTNAREMEAESEPLEERPVRTKSRRLLAED